MEYWMLQAKQTIKITAWRQICDTTCKLEVQDWPNVLSKEIAESEILYKHFAWTMQFCFLQHVCSNIWKWILLCQSLSDGTEVKTGQTLRQFIRDFGVSEQLTSDGAREQSAPKIEFMTDIRKYEIKHHVSKPHWPHQIQSESAIWEVYRQQWPWQMA